MLSFFMKTLQQRLNNIAGQINGVQKMMDNHKDCIQLLTQLKAIRSAITGVMNAVVEEQFDTCIKSLKEKDKKLLIKIKNYVQSN